MKGEKGLRGEGEMGEKIDISFVMPMFNEEENIGNAISEIESLAKDIADGYEIIITDDASTDKSVCVVEEIAKNNDKIKLFCLKENSKFGGAFAKCFEEATKEVILYMDSDMPVSTEDIKASIPLIHNADVVTGYSRIKKGETTLRKIISTGYNVLVKLLFGLKIHDINSGYKIVRKKVIEGVKFISRSPFIDVEIFLEAKKKDCKVKQFPLIFRARSGGRSYIASFPIILVTFRDMLKVKISLCKKN